MAVVKEGLAVVGVEMEEAAMEVARAEETVG